MNIDADLVDAALMRHATGTPYGVAAVMVGANEEPGRDGQRWRLVLTDGTTVVPIEAQRSATLGRIDDAEVERAVEAAAGSFDRERPLPMLVAGLDGQPLVLR